MKRARLAAVIAITVAVISAPGIYYRVDPEPVFLASAAVLLTAGVLWIAKRSTKGTPNETQRIYAD